MPALHPEHTMRNANKFRISIIDFPFASSSNTARQGTVPDRLFLKHVASLASPACRPSPASLALLSGALQTTGVGLCIGKQGRVSPAVR